MCQFLVVYLPTVLYNVPGLVSLSRDVPYNVNCRWCMVATYSRLVLVSIETTSIKRALVNAVNLTEPETVIRGGVHTVTVTTGSDFASDIQGLITMETRGTAHWGAISLGRWGVIVSLSVIGFLIAVVYPIP